MALSVGHARGQTSSAENMASARMLGTEGVRLADSNDCAAAVVKLDAAEQLYHAPTTLERLGECQIALGQIIAGTESLRRVVREQLASGAPAAFVAARQRASRALPAAERRIGKLRVHVDGVPLDSVKVTIDDAEVPSALFDATRPTDPGSHQVRATAQGYKPFATTVNVGEGAEATVNLRLEADLSPQPTPRTAEPSPASGPPVVGSAGFQPTFAASPGRSSGPSLGVALALMGVGGAGVVVGSVFGVLALNTRSTLNSECNPKTACPQGAQSDISALSTRATISSIGFGAGVAGLVVGGILLATSHGETTSDLTLHGSSLSPWIGFKAAGLQGTFE